MVDSGTCRIGYLFPCELLTEARVLAISKVPTVSMFAAITGMPS